MKDLTEVADRLQLVMVEIRKSEEYANQRNTQSGLMDCVTLKQGHVFRLGLKDSELAIQAMSNPLGLAYPKCELTMDPVIEFILLSEVTC